MSAVAPLHGCPRLRGLSHPLDAPSPLCGTFSVPSASPRLPFADPPPYPSCPPFLSPPFPPLLCPLASLSLSRTFPRASPRSLVPNRPCTPPPRCPVLDSRALRPHTSTPLSDPRAPRPHVCYSHPPSLFFPDTPLATVRFAPHPPAASASGPPLRRLWFIPSAPRFPLLPHSLSALLQTRLLLPSAGVPHAPLSTAQPARPSPSLLGRRPPAHPSPCAVPPSCFSHPTAHKSPVAHPSPLASPLCPPFHARFLLLRPFFLLRSCPSPPFFSSSLPHPTKEYPARRGVRPLRDSKGANGRFLYATASLHSSFPHLVSPPPSLWVRPCPLYRARPPPGADAPPEGPSSDVRLHLRPARHASQGGAFSHTPDPHPNPVASTTNPIAHLFLSPPDARSAPFSPPRPPPSPQRPPLALLTLLFSSPLLFPRVVSPFFLLLSSL